MKFIIIFTFIFFAQASIAKLEFKNQFINKVPSTFTLSAAYVDISNSSDKAIVLNRIESDCTQAAEFHDVVEKDGMSKMVHMKSITIEPKSTYKFFRGGKHIMLIKLKKSFFESYQCKITVYDTQKNAFSFTATAK